MPVFYWDISFLCKSRGDGNTASVAVVAHQEEQHCRFGSHHCREPSFLVLSSEGLSSLKQKPLFPFPEHYFTTHPYDDSPAAGFVSGTWSAGEWSPSGGVNGADLCTKYALHNSTVVDAGRN